MTWKHHQHRPDKTDTILIAGFREVTRLLRLILAAIKADNTPPPRVPTSYHLSIETTSER